jgi:hypothetical protein
MKRQYYITDSLLALGPKSRKFNQDVLIDWMSEDEVVMTDLIPATKLYLFASEDKSTVGVGVSTVLGGDGEDDADPFQSCPNQEGGASAELVCTGATTPTEQNGGQMLYSVSCGVGEEGARHYIGPKLYTFASSTEEGLARLHECEGFDKDTFPDYKFLGFFNKDSCIGGGEEGMMMITDADYDPFFCKGANIDLPSSGEVRTRINSLVVPYSLCEVSVCAPLTFAHIKQ